MATIPTIFPLTFAQPNWFTTRFIAARLRVNHRTVQNWIKTGFLLKRGCTILTVPGPYDGGHRTWVRLPSMRADAMLSRVPLKTIDILPTNTVVSRQI